MSILGLGFQKKISDFITGKSKPVVYSHAKNLFDYTALIDGYYINSSGVEYASANWKCTENIPVVGSTKLKISGAIATSTSAGIAFFDKNNANIASAFKTTEQLIADDYLLNVPHNAASFRISINSANPQLIQIEYGTVATTFEAYDPFPKLPAFQKPVDVILDRIDNPVDIIHTQRRFSPFTFPHGKNILNTGGILQDKTINNTGSLGTSAGWKATDYLPILGGTNIKISGAAIGSSASAGTAFYDKSKVFISWISNDDIATANNLLSVPYNAEFFRFSTYSNTPQLIQIEYGTVATTFEAYDPFPKLPSFLEKQNVSIAELNRGVTQIGLPYGKNLFNHSTANTNFLINSSGVESASTGWYSSPYIAILPYAVMCFNRLLGGFSTGAGVAFYKEDKSFISFISCNAIMLAGYSFTTPADAVYLRFSDYSITNKASLSLEYGYISTSTDIYTSISSTKRDIPFKKIITSNNLDVYKDEVGTLHACLRDVYVRYESGNKLFLIFPNGLKNKADSVVFNSTNFPGLITGSSVLRIFILPFTRNATTSWLGREWRLNVVTDKGQVYHNFPSRAASTDGVALATDHILFDEGCIWELPERWAPVKTNTGSDADLIATGKYKYYPALADVAYEFHPAISTDNGYGNSGFPAVLEKTNQNAQVVKFARFNQSMRSGLNNVSLDFMGGLLISEKLCVIGTYRSNTTNSGARIGVFYTNDGGRNWFCRYEFGTNGQIIDSSDTQISAPKLNYTSQDLFINLTPAGIGLFQVVKRSQYAPSLAVKEPVNKFKYAAPVLVSSITPGSAKITVVTASAHGLVSGDIILFEKQSGAVSNEWDWMVNSGHGANTAGDGLVFKVVVVNSTTFTLKESLHNPHNNLTCRHIHSLNKSPHGFTIGCGETYPEGWIMMHNYYHSDAFSVLMPWYDFDFIRITSTPAAAQRPLGFILKHDGTYLIGMDNDATNIGSIALPEGRTGTGIKKTSTGVYRSTIADVDDLSQAECVLQSNETAFFFQEIAGVLVFIGQTGHLAISFDGGDSWTSWKIIISADGGVSRFSGMMTERIFMIQNYVFHLKG